MELKLLRRGERIYCAPDALIYDEKTQEGGNFQNQRRRWLGDQKVHPHQALQRKRREAGSGVRLLQAPFPPYGLSRLR